MAISASDVKELRERTGVGMMECKKALVETDGDMEKAVDVLRERGLAAAEKKSSRIAAEGVVFAYYDESANKAVLVEVNSETDFVAKNDKFMEFVKGVAKTILATGVDTVDALKDTKFDGGSETVEETRQGLVLTIGENMNIRRFVVKEGFTSTYMHNGGAIGVLVGFDLSDDALASNDAVKTMSHNIAMQVAAMDPAYLDEASVPAEIVDKEKAIIVAQMQEDPKMANKPEQVLSKIAEGKMNKYYKENCLVYQEFINKAEFDGDIQSYVASVAKSVGGEIKISGYTRLMRGEGIEKKEENFAEEIAKQINAAK